MTDEHMTLFLPGPTEVRPPIQEACSLPAIGHRSKQYQELHRDTVDKLQRLLDTEKRIFLSTSSATGVMEAAVRNLVQKRLLSCVCGAFSHRWNVIAGRNGIPNDRIESEWGRPTDPEELDRQLATGKYDAVTVVHNETSTGLTNPLDEIGDVLAKYPDVLLLLDAVSSMAGTELNIDDWNVDLVQASVQKAFACPPGLALFAVSDQAMDRYSSVSNRGYYFDFANYEKYGDRHQTISTGPIPQVNALNRQLEYILEEEGPKNRYDRHRDMKQRTHEWARDLGFELFPPEQYASPTVSCIKNTRGEPIAELNEQLKERGYVISNGYGDLSEKTFRIGHMGDHTTEDLEELLDVMTHLIE